MPGYEIEGELGRGGMGVVYKARQVQLNRVVALKMILAGAHAGPDELQRFRAEAEALARLQHPNIVQIYEVGEHHGSPFFSFEFCPGGSLAGKLGGKPLQPGEAAEVIEKLARAVHAAHEKGVVHRDLKPANVLLAEDGTPKVTDFGLAKRLDLEGGQTRSGVIMGTPSYMAPEQAEGKGKEAGPAADVYALGAILYECLTGRPPFQGPTPLDTVFLVLRQDAVPPRRLQPKVPHDLETICLKCLSREPHKRYPSAEELAEDLGRFRAGEPIKARPAGRLERTWRWCQRNPALAAALTAVAALLLAGTGVSSYFALAEAEQAETARQNERAALAARAELEKSNRELRRAQENLETALGRSLLRPLLPPQPGPSQPLTEPEIEALWELAGQPSGVLRRRFVSEALRVPALTRQLRHRASLALHAAVGLDAGQRDVVEGLLLQRLQEEVPEEQRGNIVLVAATLGDLSPRAAAEVAEALTQAMTRTSDPDGLHDLARGLSAVACRLEGKEAGGHRARASAVLSRAITKTTDVGALRALVGGLSVLAPRLDPFSAPLCLRLPVFALASSVSRAGVVLTLGPTVLPALGTPIAAEPGLVPA